MKKINIFTFLLALLVFAGCDYNDDNFPGYDSATITDVVQYEGAFAGSYPDEGYFTDRTAMATAIDAMLKDTFKYITKDSEAKISVLFGDVTSGFSAADEAYTLVAADYDAMGEENGQPGRYNNFDANMDVDGYLIDFLGQKYASLAQGKVVSITYQFYASGATTTETNSYEKLVSGWHRVELNAFAADISYKMDSADYRAMGTTSGYPGRYYNFDSNMDIDHYIGVMLGQKYPYALENTTAQVTYLYYANSATTERSSYYKHDGVRWNAYDPYADVVDVTTKIAEMSFNGTDWSLTRLLGGSMKIVLAPSHYVQLVDWVKVNKPAYMSTQSDEEEYYFGSSGKYSNINNAYNTWKSYYNVNGQYDGLSNDAMQEVMDARIAEGIIKVLLPEMISTPDTGLSYQVTYAIYGGRGTGNYMQAFMYNEDEGAYEVVSSTPIKQ